MTLKKDLQQLEVSLETFKPTSFPEDKYVELFKEFNKRAKDVIYVLDESMVETEELFKVTSSLILKLLLNASLRPVFIERA